MVKEIAVIVATLDRPSLRTTVDSLKDQDVNYQLMSRCDPDISEYASRDLAVKDCDIDKIAFLDDDAYYSPGVLRKAIDYLDKYDIIDGGIRGNIFGRGNEIFNAPYLGIGTALFMRKSAYDKVGGFKLAWGTKPEDGWRMDTVLLFDAIRAGLKYKHCDDIIVDHPGPMQSQWNPRIEWMFATEYEDMVREHILPLDGRLPDVYAHREIMDDALKYIPNRMNDIILKYHRGVIVPAAYNELQLAIKQVKK